MTTTTIIATAEGLYTAPPAYVPERVKAAFKELEALGYEACGNCGCCASCVHGAMTDAGVEKYVVYHTQSAEHLSEKGQVYLNWQGDAEEIIRVLAMHGLNPEWDGRDDRNILITVPEVKGCGPTS